MKIFGGGGFLLDMYNSTIAGQLGRLFLEWRQLIDIILKIADPNWPAVTQHSISSQIILFTSKIIVDKK